MILEGAFYKVPETLDSLQSKKGPQKLYENTIRGIFLTAILGELNFRHAPNPGAAVLLNYPYPIEPTGVTPLTCDVFLDASVAGVPRAFRHLYWGRSRKSYVEIKYYSGDPPGQSTTRLNILKDIFKMTLLTGAADQGRYLLMIFDDHKPHAFLGTTRTSSSHWARQLLDQDGRSVVIDIGTENSFIRSAFKHVDPVLTLEVERLKWRRKRGRACSGFLIRVDSCATKSSKLPPIAAGAAAPQLRKRYAVGLNLAGLDR